MLTFKDKDTGIIYSTESEFLIKQYRKHTERYEEIKEEKVETKEIKKSSKKEEE